MQVLAGEDYGKAIRDRQQQRQQRDALEQQMFENAIRNNKISEIEVSDTLWVVSAEGGILVAAFEGLW